MLEEFKEILGEMEPVLGKYKSITALVQESYPRKIDGVYTESIIWVELKSKWLMLYEGPDKWGTIFTKCGFSNSKPIAPLDIDIIDFTLKNAMDKSSITIEEVADEIYTSTRMFVNRTINLENITEDDVLYMTNCTKEVLELRSLQETLKKE